MNDTENPVTEEITTEDKQDANDQSTIFNLAILAVDLNTASKMRDQRMVINTVMAIEGVLKRNPGFVSRFAAARKEAMDEATRLVALRKSVET